MDVAGDVMCICLVEVIRGVMNKLCDTLCDEWLVVECDTWCGAWLVKAICGVMSG